jgi:ACDE family multidrug resistance protein
MGLNTRPETDESAAVVASRRVYRDTNLQIVFGVTLMAVLGVSSITPAFPRIVEELGISPQAVGYLVTVFTLPGVFLTAFLGVLADQFGRKRILLPTLLLFAIAGCACGLARDFRLLLVLRFLQGIGAAGLGAMNVTIIGDLYIGEERAAAMGCNSSVLSVGTATYPAIGGALATFGWFYPFFLPLAAIPVAVAVLFSLDSPEPSRPQDFRRYLADTWKVMANRRVAALFTISTLTFILYYGSYLTYFPLLLGGTFGASPLVVGLIVSAASVATALTASQSARLAGAFSARTLIGASCLFYAVPLVAVPMVSRLGLFLIPVSVFGFAQGINMPSLMTTLAEQAPMDQRGAMMSVNGMVLRLGQTLGPLVMGGVLMISGLNGVFFAGAVCALVMLAVVLVVMN